MKLIRFGEKGSEKPGVLVGSERRDCSAYFDDWNRNFFINSGLEKLSNLIERNLDGLPVVDAGVRWGACVARPGMILCVGLNFSDHAKEAKMAIPEEPVLFMKAANTLSGPYDDVKIPKNSTKTDWEVELAMVLQKDAHEIDSDAAAADCIAGFCLMNDLSERHFQLERAGQWVKGKSCPGFSPVGPYLCTADEIPDVLNLAMRLSVNNEMLQDGSTKTMIFKPNEIIKYISQFMLLEAGDIISTGTPPGVGLGFDPPRYLKKGDVVELSIEKLGTQDRKSVV